MPISRFCQATHCAMIRRKPRRRKNVLPLETRIAVIRDYRTLTKNARILSERYGCGRTQIQNIIKAKKELLTLYKASIKSRKANNVRIRMDASVLEKIADSMATILSEWCQRNQDRGLEITESLLESAAGSIAPLLGAQSPRPIGGWMRSIADKYDFSFGQAQPKVSNESSKSLKFTDIMDELGIKYSMPPGMQVYSYSLPPELPPVSTHCDIANNLEESFERNIKKEPTEAESIRINENIKAEKLSFEVSTNEILRPIRVVNSYREALNVLGPLERFALLKGNVRAVGLINQLENLFRGELEKILQEEGIK